MQYLMMAGGLAVAILGGILGGILDGPGWTMWMVGIGIGTALAGLVIATIIEFSTEWVVGNFSDRD